MMSEIWIERGDGYFFPRDDRMSSAVRAKLRMLSVEGMAEDRIYGVLIPFAKSVLLSDEDAELLKFPPHNPYRLSIRTTGDMGHADLRYIIEVIRPDGRCFVAPKINGALLHTDGKTLYRLNADQYELVRLASASNEHIAALNRRQVMSFNLTNAHHIQKHATATDARLDNYLSADNMKVVIPERLGVEFQQIDDDKFQVQPVPIAENVDVKDFQDAFNRRREVKDIYVGKDRTRYVCPDDVQSGLRQIKSVPKISREDKERYERQPKELFSDEIFLFDDEPSDDQSDWLPVEGEFSDRVIGVEEVAQSSYFGANVYKTDWLNEEGQKDRAPEADAESSSKGERSSSTTKKRAVKKIYALKIKPNFERLDYVADSDNLRGGVFSDSALRSDKELLAHQKAGVEWMLEQWTNGCKGVLLADDMGLGKTLQTLAFIAGLKKCCRDYKKIERPMLIVAPTALLNNWQVEHERFIEENIFRAVIPLHGSALKSYETNELTPNKRRKLRLTLPRDCLALTTYETLRDYQFSFAQVEWSCIVADEVQKAKNPSAGITTALKAMQYDYAIGLSGTPVENSWTDLWSIMDFVQPAWLGDLKSFKEQYLQPLMTDSGADNIETVGRRLKKNLDPLFLRRMKTDHLSDIPRKNIFRCPEEMPDYQRQCYSSILEAARLDNDVRPLNVIAALRDVSLHPDLSTKTLESFFETAADEVINQSARLKKTFAILDEIKRRNEKALIFVVSRKMQLILARLIEQKFNIKIAPPINGTMNGAYRQRLIDEFNGSDGFNVLVLSPLAAGVGFTITSANNVIHLSRTWNPAKEDQATDRVYRIGQTRDVNVYLPLACHRDFGVGGSFDEKLDALLTHKKSLSDKVLFPTEDGIKDGLAIFNALKNSPSSTLPTYCWSIEDVDGVTGGVFERIVADLYNSMNGFKATKTPTVNDNGADVVVLSQSSNDGLLIQCKHREDIGDGLGKRAIQEVYTAIAAYENIHRGVKFQGVVVTNAEGFTSGAVELARQNNVRLIARNELAEMLRENQVLKF